MFYVAEALLPGEDVVLSKHSAVIAVFGQRFAKTRRVPPKFHRYLIEGQTSRNVGDYDTGPGLSSDQSAEQIARAEQFLRLAEDRIGPVPPPGEE